MDKADKWLKDNLKQPGGRAVLVILKDGKIAYEKLANNLSPKQKIDGKFVAKRQVKNADEVLQEYRSITGDAIAGQL
jgi:hypothetical protein